MDQNGSDNRRLANYIVMTTMSVFVPVFVRGQI